MNIWVILGIEMTRDEDAINAAYHKKLQLVHPEDHPEEFMQLRAAYDEALKYARQPDEETVQKEKTPVDLWLDRVKEVYDSLPRRIDPNEWRTLLDDDVCHGLDSRLDARDAFLQFAMECFYLPVEIWRLLEEDFSFREHREELYERFPREYIDNAVIGGTDGYPVVPYHLFAEGTTDNPDDYIRLYIKARRERRGGEYEACEATIRDMENSGFEHPFTRFAWAELYLSTEKIEEAYNIITELAERYPEDIDFRLTRGEVLRGYKEDYEGALADFEFVLGVIPKHNTAQWGKAECLRAQGKLEEAKSEYLEIHQRLPFDDNVNSRVEEINKQLIERYEQQLAENPGDFELRMDYAWSCLQRRELDRAKELIAEAHPDTIAEQSDFHNFCTKLYINREEAEEALEHAREWEALLPQLPEGEDEKEKKRKGKLPEILYLQAVALYMLERDDEALEKANAAEAADPTKTDPRDLRRRIYHRRRQYEKAITESEKNIELEPSYVNWYNLAYDQYMAGEAVAAYHSLGEALDYGRVLQAYIFRARILCDLDEWDMVRQTIEYLEENGIESEQDVMRYLRARVLHQEDKKDEALAEYNALLHNIESGESPIDFSWEIYYKAADIEDDNGVEPDEVMLKVDKGLEARDDYLPLLDLKSYLLWKARRLDEQMELNRRILELYPNHRAANERIGDVLYDNKYEYEQALEYYYRQERLRDSYPLQEVMGLCLMYLGRHEEAEPHFLRAIEIAPEKLRPRSNLGLLYERQYDFERSLPLQQECVRINEENGNEDKNCLRRMARTLARLRRYDEAMDAYRRNYEQHNDPEDARHVVEVCMESGRFELAEKLLEQYHDDGVITEPYLEIKTDIVRLRGKAYLRYIKKMPAGERKLYRLALYYTNHRKYARALEYFRQLEAADPDRAHWSTDYVVCLRELGMDDERKRVAELNLQRCEESGRRGWNTTLALAHRAMILVADRQLEEAKAVIDRAMTAPLCDHCRYSKCKDAMGALAEYYLAVGEPEKALEVYREGLEIAPDEFDFADSVKEIIKEYKLK